MYGLRTRFGPSAQLAVACHPWKQSARATCLQWIGPKKKDAVIRSSYGLEPRHRLLAMPTSKLADMWERRTTVVLHGPATRVGAIDLESKFTEAALGNLQVADWRNFAHGRHHAISVFATHDRVSPKRAISWAYSFILSVSPLTSCSSIGRVR
jgi:hypothetical protein